MDPANTVMGQSRVGHAVARCCGGVTTDGVMTSHTPVCVVSGAVLSAAPAGGEEEEALSAAAAGLRRRRSHNAGAAAAGCHTCLPTDGWTAGAADTGGPPIHRQTADVLTGDMNAVSVVARGRQTP